MAEKHMHSPGPWIVGPVDDTVVSDASGLEVAAIDGDYNTPDTWLVMEANARLIAAAPDMLAALEAIEAANERVCALRSQAAYLEIIKITGADEALDALDEARTAARAAIRAATGEE